MLFVFTGQQSGVYVHATYVSVRMCLCRSTCTPVCVYVHTCVCLIRACGVF